MNAVFTEGLESQGVGLLGQAGFLDHFPVVFHKAEKVFSVNLPSLPPTDRVADQPDAERAACAAGEDIRKRAEERWSADNSGGKLI